MTYHYVRDVHETPFPGIRARSVQSFISQLHYFETNYQIIHPGLLIEALVDGTALPQNALLLTFDDGYIDHYTDVVPLLVERGIFGIFFPATLPLISGQVLHVNKIQHLLAKVPARELARHVADAVEANTGAAGIETLAAYRAKFANASRYDDGETAFVKRTLQKGLPDTVSTPLVNRLFEKYVCADEAEFARTLYASQTQLAEMKDAGMLIGCHGHSHAWLDTLSDDAVRSDLRTSLSWLREAGLIDDPWTMCYPYGGYDDRTLRILSEMNCLCAFTVTPATADVYDHPLTTAEIRHKRLCGSLPKHQDRAVGLVDGTDWPNHQN